MISPLLQQFFADGHGELQEREPKAFAQNNVIGQDFADDASIEWLEAARCPRKHEVM